MQHQPVAAKPFPQNGKHTLAAMAVLKGQHTVIGESHQLA